MASKISHPELYKKQVDADRKLLLKMNKRRLANNLVQSSECKSKKYVNLQIVLSVL